MKYEDVQPGVYQARAISGKFDISKTKGTEYVELEFLVNVTDTETVKLRWTGWLTEKTQKRTAEALVIAGFDLAKANTLGVQEFDENFFAKDAICDVAVGEEFYEKDGQQKRAVKINWINKPGGALKSSLQPGGAKSIMARLKADMLEARAELGIKPQEKSIKNHAPGADTDTIPF